MTHSMSLNINLEGLENKWQTRGSVCTVCGKDWDRADDDDDDDSTGGCSVPLLFWRNDGREMLTLCWDCATPRMASANAALTGERSESEFKA